MIFYFLLLLPLILPTYSEPGLYLSDLDSSHSPLCSLDSAITASLTPQPPPPPLSPYSLELAKLTLAQFLH